MSQKSKLEDIFYQFEEERRKSQFQSFYADINSLMKEVYKEIGVGISKELHNSNPLLSQIPKTEAFQGSCTPVPIKSNKK